MPKVPVSYGSYQTLWLSLSAGVQFVKYILAYLLLCLPCAAADVALNHVGICKLPPIEASQYGPKFPNNYQWIAPHKDADKLYLTWGRSIGVVVVPTPVLTTDPAKAPLALWYQCPRVVGLEYRDLIVEGGFDAGRAELRGICVHKNNVWLNYGKYYHVDPATYRNLSSISIYLPTAAVINGVKTEAPLMDLANPPHVRNHSGWIAALPAGWHPTYDVIRGNYWQTDGGPRMQAVDLDGPDKQNLPWAWACSYDVQYLPGTSEPDYTKSHVVEQWARWGDTPYLGGVPLVSGGEKLFAVVACKGTAPGWYGSPVSPDGVTDLCSNAKGSHAYPYKPMLLVYRWADLAQVISGLSQPWTPQPVQRVALPGFFHECSKVSGVCLQAGKLWAVETVPIGGGASANVIHAYEVR